MGQHRGEPFIVILDRHFGHSLPPTVDKLLHTLQILTRFTVRLTRLSYHDTFHGLFCQISLQPVEQL